jgi:hypothetical protein
MNYKEFKARGGSITFLVILAAILSAIIWYALGGNPLSVPPVLNVGIAAVLLCAAAFVFFAGDKLFGKKSAKYPNWKGDYWLWAAGVVILLVLAFCTLVVWHSGPLKA